MKAKIYVGTYGKYSAGSIEGKWLDLADYSSKEEFYTACKELHSDEEDAEFMFQDYEGIPECLISEGWISDNVFEVLEALDELSDDEREAFDLWVADRGSELEKEDINRLVDTFRDGYCGLYPSEWDFAYELVNECYDLSEFAKTYFDYEMFARDLFMCDYDYYDGHVFRRY